MSSEKELAEMAKEELLRDIKSASARAEMFGAHRWAKPAMLVANKRFLRNMLYSGKKERFGVARANEHRRRVVYSTVSKSKNKHYNHKDSKNTPVAVEKEKKKTSENKEKEQKYKERKTKDSGTKIEKKSKR